MRQTYVTLLYIHRCHHINALSGLKKVLVSEKSVLFIYHWIVYTWWRQTH
jgi:hypothetical protein